MPKIAVFDSGLGSFSVVRELQKSGKHVEIIYFADIENFPYGSKSKERLNRIINNTISRLKERFDPDVVIIASNTPTMVLNITDGHQAKYDDLLVLGVRPLLAKAIEISQTGKIVVLGTASGIKSAGLSNMIKQHTNSSSHCNYNKIYRINGSPLVNAVESGMFLTDVLSCRALIRKILTPVISRHNIDVVTLSSTHLPFLSHILQAEYPFVQFIDPARHVVQTLFSKYSHKKSDKNSLKIYASGSYSTLQNNLTRLGVNHTVRQF